jgi:hypothetical protein
VFFNQSNPPARRQNQPARGFIDNIELLFLLSFISIIDLFLFIGFLGLTLISENAPRGSTQSLISIPTTIRLMWFASIASPLVGWLLYALNKKWLAIALLLFPIVMAVAAIYHVEARSEYRDNTQCPGFERLVGADPVADAKADHRRHDDHLVWVGGFSGGLPEIRGRQLTEYGMGVPPRSALGLAKGQPARSSRACEKLWSIGERYAQRYNATVATNMGE